MTHSTNPAVQLTRQMFGMASPDDHGVNPFDQDNRASQIHPDIEFSLFGKTGTKEFGRGAAAYFDFISGCLAAIADRSDEILDIVAIDEECVFVRAQAWRKSASTGEEARYQWSTLTRMENGQITYVTDMLDRDAQEFWRRIAG